MKTPAKPWEYVWYGKYAWDEWTKHWRSKLEKSYTKQYDVFRFFWVYSLKPQPNNQNS